MKDPILKTYGAEFGADVSERKRGQYLRTAHISGLAKINRLKTLDELQAAWCIEGDLLDEYRARMDAHAIAWNHFCKVEVDPKQADIHAEYHKLAAVNVARYQGCIMQLQDEFQFRMDNPEYDPDDPFADDDPGPLPGELRGPVKLGEPQAIE